MNAYFTSRAALTSRQTILDARECAATASLQRILGEQPEGLDRVTDLLRRAADAARWEGRPIFGGLRSLGFPTTPLTIDTAAALFACGLSGSPSCTSRVSPRSAAAKQLIKNVRSFA